MPIDLGDSVTRSINLTSSAGVAVDADSLPTYAVTLPDGTAGTSPTVQHGVTGEYYLVYPTVQSGLHQELWTAIVAGVTVVIRRNFTVEQASTSFIDTDEALAGLRAVGIIVKPSDLEELRLLCGVACDAVERDLGRAIARRVVVEDYSITHPVVLRQAPVISIMTVSVDGAPPVDPTTYRVDPFGVLITRYGWISPAGWWPGIVTVTYQVGYTDPPRIARKVARNAVQRMWQQSQQMPHPAMDDIGVEAALFGAVGTLTPVELSAYGSLRVEGLA